MLTRLRSVARDESGITLVEVLVTTMIGMVVLVAMLTLLDSGASSASRTIDRAEVAQRGRVAMNAMTRALRSQVCKDSQTPPIVSGSDSSITFYSDADSDAAFTPQAVTIALDTTWKGGRGAILQDTYPSTDTTATPTRRVLVEDVAAISGTPFLTYFSFDGANAMTNPLSGTITGSPLPGNSIAKVLQTGLAFRVAPSVASGNSGALSGRQLDTTRGSDFKTQVWVRNSDYTDQVAANNTRVWGPRCS